MSEIIRWQDSAVDVQARLDPRFLWSTASIDVFLDEECIFRTGGQLKATGSLFCDVHAFWFHTHRRVILGIWPVVFVSIQAPN